MEGKNVLERGGNALDACVAMNATLTVAYPHMCGLGGDLFLLYFDATQDRVFALNGSGRAPRLATPDAFRRRGFQRIPARGPLSATVPGVVDAWQTAIDRFGSMSLRELLAPAIDVATSGIEITERLASWMANNQADLASDAYLRKRFLSDAGSPLPAGTRLRLPELAVTLEAVAQRGADDFYRGELAAELDRAVRNADGLLTGADLAEHRSQWVEPVAIEVGACKLYTTPPNSQGFVALQMLMLLARWNSARHSLESSDYIDDAVRAKTLAFSDRARYLGDPDFSDVPVDRLLSSAHLDELSAQSLTTAEMSTLAGDTVYMAAIDGDGNSCSLIQSIYYAFGSAFSIGTTGIVLHNRAHYFTLDPRSINCLAGRKRPAHTLMASMAVQNGRPLFVVGTMGADGQPQTVTQVVMRILAGEHPQNAVAAPRCLSGRFLLEDPDDALLVEADFEEATCEDLRRRGHLIAEAGRLDERMGHAHAICLRPDGLLTAGSDPRSDGAGLVVALPRTHAGGS